MQREHEEAMRAEFAERVSLENKRLDPATTDAELDRIWERTSDINERWAAGPHAEQWEFLNDAYYDWQRSPQVMERVRADLAHNQAQGDPGGFDEVQMRSIEQTRQLTQPQQQNQRPVRER
ncbi:hypothetical protein ACFYU5_05085 [Nocardia aobensis]|uniref:Uncharacterized protein n=1 Tax=Nocardia aobensis TaxID=257277 RepID=A0ABW6NZK4_9NOCA